MWRYFVFWQDPGRSRGANPCSRQNKKSRHAPLKSSRRNYGIVLAQCGGVLHNERMKTLTIKEGRGRLGYWLKQAMRGDDIGFVLDGKVVALRPVEVYSSDYALQEYGLSEREMAAAEKRIRGDIQSARADGGEPGHPWSIHVKLFRRKAIHIIST
jgi:hypothetical protein